MTGRRMISFSPIPAEFWPQVATALEQAFGTTELAEIRPVLGGLSSTIAYQLVFANRSYILRISTQDQPRRPYTCLRLAAEAGIAPHVYFADEVTGVSIADFIGSRGLAHYTGSRSDLLRELATTVRAIHHLPPFPAFVNFLETVDRLISRFQASATVPIAALHEYFEAFARIRAAYRTRDIDLCPSHNDLNPANILYDGQRLWIIDWEESAFQNDRYTDLAIIGIFFLRDGTDEETLLGTYFGEAPDSFKTARFFLMQQICRMYYAMIVLTLVESRDISGDMQTPCLKDVHAGLASGNISLFNDEGKVLWGKALLNEFLTQSRTSRFADSINLVGP